LRKFALIPSTCAVLLCTALASAQQVDVAVGDSILFSTKNPNASEAFLPPAEKGGLYPSFSFDRIFKNHYGYGAELATSYKQENYNGFQGYRPIFYDVNALFAPHIRNRTDVDLMAGVGGERVLFYSPSGSCNFSVGCTTHLDANHLLFHVGTDVRYRVWKHFFVRPEAHLYHIVNNAEFHSDNVLRVGGSIGYTFGLK
jgi:hypothetical protein